MIKTIIPEETLISFKTAKLAFLMGFYGNLKSFADDYKHLKAAGLCPSQSVLQKWLRKRNIDVVVNRDSEVHYRGEIRWIVTITNWNEFEIFNAPIAQIKIPKHSHHIDFKSYESALEKGLIEGLKLIIT